MTVWDDLAGQSDAITVFRAAAEPATVTEPGGSEAPAESEISVGSEVAADSESSGDPESLADSEASVRTSMTHSWLITGPPGSGRSNLAYAFAAALLCPDAGCGVCPHCVQVAARTHPDLAALATERVIITIDEVRRLVTSAQFSPSVGRFRVMVIEDADRMTERTSNLLLKSLEEPPPRTVWILCAPSSADLLPTIRSRVRTVRLRVPDVADVAELIARRVDVDEQTARRAAREAQSHIGMALRLATNPEARARREETLQIALGLRSVSDAVVGAARLLQIAGDDAKAITTERDAEEREQTLRSLGVEPGQAAPMALRSHLRQLEENQKRRATRSLRDGIDRILVDLLSLNRDVMKLQLGVGGDLVNLELDAELRAAASASTAAATVATMDAIALARDRIDSNVAPALALESMLITAVQKEG